MAMGEGGHRQIMDQLDLQTVHSCERTNESQVTDLDFLVASHVCSQLGRRIFAHELVCTDD